MHDEIQYESSKGCMSIVADNLPYNLSKPNYYNSDVTKKVIKGDGFVLDDNNTFMTLEEAILWSKTVGFSPLNSCFPI